MAKNPTPSELDAAQVIKRSFDGDNDRLRVDIESEITLSGQQEIAIDQVDDTIQVYGTDDANVNRPIRTNEHGNLSIDGVYNASTNTNPSSSQIIVSARDSSPDNTNQVTRATGVSNGNVHAQDIALSDGEANNITSQDNGSQRALDVGINVSGIQVDPRTRTWTLSQTTDSIKLGDGTDIALITSSGELNVLSTAQPGTDVGDVTINNSSGAAAVNIQDGGNIISVDDAGGSITVDGTTTANQGGTWNINNISGTISLPTGAATLANQASQISSLSSIDSKFNSLGQKSMTSSMPVAIASDQTSIPVTQSGTWNINNVSGTVSLPTGAATSINQTTEITALQLIDDVVYANNAVFNKATAIAGQLDDISTTVATEDNISSVRITSQRAVHNNLRNQAGTEIATSSNPIRTDPTGTTPQPVTQSGTWTVQQGATPTSIANAWPIKSTDGTNSQSFSSTGEAKVAGSIASAASDSGNPIKIGGVYNSTPPSFTNNQRADLQVDINGSVFVNTSGRKSTYASTSIVTAAVNATDICTITGSVSKIVRITNIEISGTNTGTTNIKIDAIKRSTANSAGTSTISTNIPFDSTNSAATAVVRNYSTNPTLGTTVGTIRSRYVFFPSLASTNAGSGIEFTFGDLSDQELILRGTSEVLAINLGGTLITGTTIASIVIEWTEE